MATWQYTLYLIPRASVLNRFGSLPSRITRTEMNEGTWWFGHVLGHELDVLNSMFPARKPWHTEMRAWGSDDGDSIDVFLNDSAIDEFVARVDARSGDSDFLRQIASFASQFDLLFVTEELNLREPVWDQLRLDLERSSAMEFSKDPEGYLRRRGGAGTIRLED